MWEEVWNRPGPPPGSAPCAALRRRPHRRPGTPGRAALLLAAGVGAASVHAEELQLPPIEVRGHYENSVGSSDAASQGTVSVRTFEDRPVQRPGEVLETIPGLVINQHSGDGKANQYYLRGYNLDHGTDFATFVAGMPINLRTHAHGQGYTDLNFLIPELIERVDYHKGPYFAEDGDFASAGSARIHYAEALKHTSASLTVGQYGYRRGLLAGSPEFQSGRVTYGLELVGNDGPWLTPGDFRKYNGVLRIARGDGNNGFNVSAMAYAARWNATNQNPLRAFDSGLIGRFGEIDRTDQGNSSRYSLSSEWRELDDSGRSRASAYVVRSRLQLTNDFTFFLESPSAGDQFQQSDARTLFGGEASRQWLGRLGSRESTTTVGVQLRRDRIDPLALYNTVSAVPAAKPTLFQDGAGNLLAANGSPLLDSAGNPTTNPLDPRAVTYLAPAVTRLDRVTESSAALYLQNMLQWTDWARTIEGIRADQYGFDVASNITANSGHRHARIVSPKLALILGPWQKTEYFFNYGRGFHSNDARGVTTSVDPRSCAQPTGCQSAPSVTPLVRTVGYEAGLRSEIVPKVQTSIALWRLKQDSELLFTGDAGTTEASRPSLRDGFEWELHYTPAPSLVVDLACAVARARFNDGDPAAIGTRIPGALERVFTAALTVPEWRGWFGSVDVRYFGPRPLIEDDSVRSRSSFITNLRLGRRLNRIWSVNLDVFNLFDRQGSSVEYYYLSRITPIAPALNDTHLHPEEPRQIRVTLSATF